MRKRMGVEREKGEGGGPEVSPFLNPEGPSGPEGEGKHILEKLFPEPGGAIRPRGRGKTYPGEIIS
jgi:hypothetical protein